MSFFNQLLSGFKASAVLTQLIIINAVVFIIANLVTNFSSFPILDYLMLPSAVEYLLFRFWTIITYMFTHQQFGHAFFNLLWLYMLGQIFNLILTERRLLFVYLLGGISGGLLFIISDLLLPSFGIGGVLLGASAAVSAVAVVVGIMAPNMPVQLMFIGEVKLKWVVIASFVLSTLIDFSVNTGGKISHIGGALFGLWYGIQMKSGNDLSQLFSKLFKKKTKLKVVHHSGNSPYGSSSSKSDEEKMLNELLDKINKSGYESLSKREKEILHQLSRKN